MQAHRFAGAAEIGDRVRELSGNLRLRVADGRQDHDPRVRRCTRQVAQQQQRGRVRPLPVLDHEEQWTPAARLRQEVGDRDVQTVALRVGVERAVDFGQEPRQQPLVTATVGSIGREQRGKRRCDQGVDASGSQAP